MNEQLAEDSARDSAPARTGTAELVNTQEAAPGLLTWNPRPAERRSNAFSQGFG